MEAVRTSVEFFMKTRGFDENRIKGILGRIESPKDVDAAAKEIKKIQQRIELVDSETSSNRIQRTVGPSQLDGYLKKGWSFVDELGDGRVVVATREQQKQVPEIEWQK